MFTNGNNPGYFTSEILFYILIVAVILFLVFVFVSRYLTRNLHHHHEEESIPLGTIIFKPQARILFTTEWEKPLCKEENVILLMLTETPNQVVSREQLIKRLGEQDGVVEGESLDTYIYKLREKLANDSQLKISKLHGIGYRLNIISS